MSNEIEHEYMEHIVCPYCGFEHIDLWTPDETGEMSCSECEKIFGYSVTTTTECTTTKIDLRGHYAMLKGVWL